MPKIIYGNNLALYFIFILIFYSYCRYVVI